LTSQSINTRPKITIKEVPRVSGGDLGGEEVDKIFIDFLENLFTKENIQQIKKDITKIMQDFEKAKRRIKMDIANGKVSIGTSELCPWKREHFNSLTNKI